MSGRLFEQDILFLQRMLSCCGLYDRKLDGLWGTHTDKGEREFLTRADGIAAAEGSFDARTERNVRSLDLRAQPFARRSLASIRKQGLDARIISGTRTYAEQTAIYRQGRFGNRGPIVSNAKAGQSWHNFGLAWDIGIFANDGAYLTGSAPYTKAGPFGRMTGVEWGGDWRSFKDMPHFQTPFGASTVSMARSTFENGGRNA